MTYKNESFHKVIRLYIKTSIKDWKLVRKQTEINRSLPNKYNKITTLQNNTINKKNQYPLQKSSERSTHNIKNYDELHELPPIDNKNPRIETSERNDPNTTNNKKNQYPF